MSCATVRKLIGKSIVRFFRNELVINEVARCLERDGHGGLASVMRSVSLVSFANWRWGTLADVCRVVSTFASSLAENFDASPFVDQRDTTDFKMVVAALKSASWHRLLEFVTWYTRHLTDLMEWAGGCPCHNSMDDSGRAHKCDRRGRRLHQAYSEISRVLSDMLAEATEWTPNTFGGDVAMWQECQGMVRFTFVYGKEKSAFLNKVPYLLAKLGEACLADRSLRQWLRRVALPSPKCPPSL